MKEKFEEFCKKFIGYENEKKELLRILDWFQDEEIINNNNVDLCRAILFHGPAGNGKTTILREYSKCFNAPIYNLSDIDISNVDELTKNIIEVFRKAREEKFAVILIDEIDNLVKINAKILRLFQSELDGLSSNKNLLILAAVNDVDDVPASLLRTGRFNKRIEIGDPNIKDRELLIKRFLEDLKVDTKNLSVKKLVKRMTGCSCVQIKAIINDSYLRYNTNITESKITDSFLRIVMGTLPSKKDNVLSERKAVYNAGKILMVLNYKNLFNFKSFKYIDDEAIYLVDKVHEKGLETEYIFSRIDILLSGIVAEEVVYGNHDIGSIKDVDRVFTWVNNLIVNSGLEGIKYVLKEYDDKSQRYETKKKNNYINKLINKTVLTHYKNCFKFLKKNKKDLLKVKDVLLSKNEFSENDISNINLLNLIKEE